MTLQLTPLTMSNKYDIALLIIDDEISLNLSIVWARSLQNLIDVDTGRPSRIPKRGHEK